MTKKAPRYFFVEEERKVGGQNTNQVLPKLSDTDVERLYEKLGRMDPAQKNFKGSKREYVSKVTNILFTYLSKQASFAKNNIPSINAKRTLRGGGDSNGETSDEELEELDESEETGSSESSIFDFTEEEDEELEESAEKEKSREKEEPEETESSEEEYTLPYLKKQPITNDGVEESKSGEKPIPGVPMAAKEAVEPVVKKKKSDVFLEEINKLDVIEQEQLRNVILTTGVQTVKKSKFDAKNPIVEITDDPKAKRKVASFNKVIETAEMPDFDIFINDLEADQIDTYIDLYQRFWGYAIEELELQPPNVVDEQLTQEDKEALTARSLRLILYDKIADFDQLNGEASLQRLTLIHHNTGSNAFSAEIGKVAECLMRGMKDVMDNYGFGNETENLSRFIFYNDKIKDSDILDYIGPFNKFTVGEHKCFEISKPRVEFQDLKTTMLAHMYEAISTGKKEIVMVHKSKEQHLKLSSRYRKDIKSGRTPILPIFITLYDEAIRSIPDIPTTDALPITMVFNLYPFFERLADTETEVTITNNEKVIKKTVSLLSLLVDPKLSDLSLSDMIKAEKGTISSTKKRTKGKTTPYAMFERAINSGEKETNKLLTDYGITVTPGQISIDIYKADGTVLPIYNSIVDIIVTDERSKNHRSKELRDFKNLTFDGKIEKLRNLNELQKLLKPRNYISSEDVDGLGYLKMYTNPRVIIQPKTEYDLGVKSKVKKQTTVARDAIDKLIKAMEGIQKSKLNQNWGYARLKKLYGIIHVNDPFYKLDSKDEDFLSGSFSPTKKGMVGDDKKLTERILNKLKDRYKTIITEKPTAYTDMTAEELENMISKPKGSTKRVDKDKNLNVATNRRKKHVQSSQKLTQVPTQPKKERKDKDPGFKKAKARQVAAKSESVLTPELEEELQDALKELNIQQAKDKSKKKEGVAAAPATKKKKRKDDSDEDE